MKAVKVIGTVLFVLLLVPAASQAATHEIHVQFFSDAALNNLVGETTDWCDNSETSWGNVAADYIANYRVSCTTDEVTDVNCYYWTGSYYASMPCYWDGSRVRITVG